MEVSAIRFSMKDFQYGLFHGFRGRAISICYRFVEITDLIFSVRNGYFNKITNFYKVWSNVFEVEEFESAIGLSKLLTWFSQ